MHGTVVEFDAHKGYGTIASTDGRSLFFHCTQLADGSRTIEVGTPVTFELEPRLPGRYEAVAVTPA